MRWISPAQRLGDWVRQQAGSYKLFIRSLSAVYSPALKPARALSRRSLCWRTPPLCRSRLAGDAEDQSPPSALAIGFASKPAPTNYSFAHYQRFLLQLLNRPGHYRAGLSAAGERRTPVGAGLLANAFCLSRIMLNVPASSRASALLQVIRHPVSPAANTASADDSSAHCRARRPFSSVNASVLR
jgi:hypothetical protein